MLAEPPVLRSRSEQQSRAKKDTLQMGSAGQVTKISTTKHADSDSDSWNDEVLEDSIEYRPNITVQYPARPDLPQPSRSTNSRGQRNKVDDDSDDGALSDITPEKSPSKINGRQQQQQQQVSTEKHVKR